jgi:hypothetical protein
MKSNLVARKAIVQNSEHVVKDLVDAVHRTSLRTLLGNSPPEASEILSQLKNTGFSIVRNFWSPERCWQAIRQLDLGIESPAPCHYWVDPEGSDHRLWYAERLAGEMISFLDDPFIEIIRKYYSGVRTPEKLLLAARLSQTPENKGSGGGWHRDSPHSLQFKAILYLSDVTEENGPFQYLEGTHHASSSIQLLRKKLCHPNQYRFSEHEITRIIAEGVLSHTFIATAGTLILVDTKGIHRGQPIQVGCRYALTQYCFNGKKPKNFLS